MPAEVCSIEANAILDACQSCWVFAGMGSWNDMGFDGDDQKIYEEVSERLFQSATGAIVAATNSTFAGGEKLE